MAIPPFEIDLIEVLYGTGEVTMGIVHKMAHSAEQAWKVLPAMVGSQTAAVWLVDQPAERRLEAWEVAAIARSRFGSGAPAPPDEVLRVRAAERTSEAYDRDYGAWYYGEGPGKQM